MAIDNFLCERCNKNAVCRVLNILYKFHEDNKKQLGVDIIIDKCDNFANDVDGE